MKCPKCGKQFYGVGCPECDYPHYVTCRCQRCDGHIKFNANEFSEDNSIVPCPHCGSETKLYLTDHEESFKWILKGVKCGDVESMALLGAAYLYGLNVPQNYSEAVTWLLQAAEQGNSTAENNLGFCYYQGYGVAQNYTEAEKWIRKAAEHGDSVAQYHLGCLYHFGQGVSQNPFEAFTWWLKAADSGHIIAQNNVGFLFEEGKVIDQDLIEARKWMRLAAAQGYKGADEHSNEMASKMNATQLAESERRVDKFKLENKKDVQPRDCGIIGRLATMGDSEAQEIMRRIKS